MALIIEISSTDRSEYIQDLSLSISKNLDSDIDSCDFTMIFRDLPNLSFEINAGEPVEVKDGANTIFGGFIENIAISRLAEGNTIYTQYNIDCMSYEKEWERKIVNEVYVGQTAKAIIQDLNTTYFASGFNFDATTNVDTGPTIASMKFSDITALEALNKLADYCGYYWYIDESKKIHFFEMGTASSTPFNITNSERSDVIDFNVQKCRGDIRNRIFVRGGEFEWDTAYEEKQITIQTGDSAWSTKFKAKDFAYKDYTTDGIGVQLSTDSGANWNDKTIGLKNIDDNKTPAYDFLYDFNNKVLLPKGYSVNNNDLLEMKYKPLIPLRQIVKNPVSIADQKDVSNFGDGIFDFLIVDESITTIDEARGRAKAILDDQSSLNSNVSGNFRTFTSGFEPGQVFSVNDNTIPVDGTFLVQSVSIEQVTHRGSSKVLLYTISFARRPLNLEKFLADLYREQKKRRIADEHVNQDLLPVEELSITAVTQVTKNANNNRWNQVDWNFFVWE